jgi:GNAT superfamily N-acetyltransferase
MTELGTARAEELPQLVALLGILFSQESEFAPDAAKQARALETILSDDSVGRIYVAREGGKVVGMATLLYTVSTAEGGRAALLEDVVVLPAERGRGLGSALLRHVFGEAGKQGVLRVTLLTDARNEPAQRLYSKLGFEPSTMTAMRLRWR